MALKLVDTPSTCSELTFTGWSNFGWVTCTDEIKKMNRSKRDMALASAAPILGELLMVGEAVDFTGAAVGKGYWRKMEMVIDHSNFEGTWKNNGGSTAIDQKYKFRVSGMSPLMMEWFLSVMSCCGLSFVTPDKQGRFWELGNKLSPSKVDNVKISSSKDNQFIEGELIISYPPRLIDVVVFPMDETPNV